MGTMIDRSLSVLLAVVALALVGILVRREFFPSYPSTSRKARPTPEFYSDWQRIASSGHLMGNIDAHVVVVEFGDFECYFCGQFGSIYSALAAQMGDSISLVFHHFPLTRIHRFAMPSARAAVCASNQGHWGEFYSLLFEKQDSLGLKTWWSFADEAGVRDSTAFSRCVQQNNPIAEVDLGLKLGRELEITGTPALLINGWLVRGGITEEEFVTAVRTILAGENPDWW